MNTTLWKELNDKLAEGITGGATDAKIELVPLVPQPTKVTCTMGVGVINHQMYPRVECTATYGSGGSSIGLQKWSSPSTNTKEK